jgi:acetyltransferase-like isoleucine patch superfamily enzyme
MKLKSLTVLFLGLLPNSIFKTCALRLTGWEIGKKARISPNLFLNASKVSIGSGAQIRAFNIFRNVSLEVGGESIIGSFNWVGAARGLSEKPNFKGLLSLGQHSAINSRNYFDVSGGVIFGDFSDLAGVRSTFITHQIDLSTSIQTCNTIEIGNHSMICSNSILVPGGTQIGNRCLFAMGSVIRAGNYPSGGFYAGMPAIFKKNTSGVWFIRKIGSTG